MVRSRIRSRSNSAKVAKIPNTMRPDAVVVDYEALRAWDTEQSIDEMLCFMEDEVSKTWQKQVQLSHNKHM